MEKKDIVINMLVFLSEHQKGVPQSEILKKLIQYGFRKVEVRREFFKDIEMETEEIGSIAKEQGVEIFYSVPEPLFIEKKIPWTKIETYFVEAAFMGCSYVKLILGDFGTVEEEEVSKMNALCKQYGIHLMIENDQTSKNGKVEKIFTFLKSYQEMGGAIGITFDIGNWIWQKEDPMFNAIILFPYVEYIHVKDVRGKETPETVYLNEGDISWREVLMVLPCDVPIALEYPCGEQPYKQLLKEISWL